MAAAGRDHCEAGAGLEQLRDCGGGLDHVFDVVEDQDDGAVAQSIGENIQRRPLRGFLKPKLSGNRGEDEGGVGDGVEANEGGALREARVAAGVDVREDMGGEPGLSDATGAGEGDQVAAIREEAVE